MRWPTDSRGRDIPIVGLVQPGLDIRGCLGRVGFGDVSLSDITGTQDGGAAWNLIQSQIQAEGGAANDVQDNLLQAQTTFVNAFNGMSALSSDGQQIIQAAQQYTLGVNTVLGSVQTLGGLLQAAESGNFTQQDAQAFMGAMVGIATTVGIASAGVGAAIMAGVAISFEALQSVGLVPTPVNWTTIPGCAGYLKFDPNKPPPFIRFGCVTAGYTSAAAAQVSGPQNANWRHFPNPSNAADKGWFAVVPNGGPGGTQWYGTTWLSDGGPRMIDAAFPQYRHLECEQNYYLAGAPGQFQQTYFAAWKLNKELAFNGGKPLDDATVLARVLTTWNRSHASGSPYTFQSAGNDSKYMPSPGPNACTNYPSYGPYIGYLVTDYAQHVEEGQPTTVTINTGDLLNPPDVSASLANASSTTSDSSTLGKVAGFASAASGAALVASAVYAAATKQSVTSVLGKTWTAITNRVTKK
jgi:hypothetical protein